MQTNASVPPLKQSASVNTPDFFGMTKAQLLAYAEDKGIKGVSGTMKKAEIIAKIEGA